MFLEVLARKVAGQWQGIEVSSAIKPTLGTAREHRARTHSQSAEAELPHSSPKPGLSGPPIPSTRANRRCELN